MVPSCPVSRSRVLDTFELFRYIDERESSFDRIVHHVVRRPAVLEL